jgi:hypothetical protein
LEIALGMRAARSPGMRKTTLVMALVAIGGCTTQGPERNARESSTTGGEARVEFEDFDRDHDDSLDDREFFGAAERYHDAWDENRDGGLTGAELKRGLALTWDRDGDARIDETEFNANASYFLPATMTADFGEWDRDASGLVDGEEMGAKLERIRLFNSYDGDGDGTVTDRELCQAIFETWDTDGDGSVDALEWRMD